MVPRNRPGWRILVVCLVCLPLLAVLPLMAGASRPGEPDAGLEIIESSADGLIFSLAVPAFESVKTTLDGRSFAQISAAGLDGRFSQEGVPELPAESVLVALPPGAVASVELLTVERQLVELAHPVLPGAGLLVSGEQASSEIRSPSATAYSQDAFYPQDQVIVGRPGYYRDQRVARVSLYPLRVNPATNQLEHVSRMVVRVRFEGGDDVAGRPALTPSAESERLLAANLINYEQGRAWRSLPADFRAPNSSLEAGVPVYKIEVDSDGVYQVGYADLLAAGMDVAQVNPLSLTLSSQGEPVAYSWQGDADTQFEAGEGIRFYGQAFRGTVMEEKYTGVNVYWLAVGDELGLRMATAESAPAGAPAATSYRATMRLEQDLLWNPLHTTTLGDQETWFWVRERGSLSSDLYTRTIPVTLTAVASGEYSATVALSEFSDCWYSCGIMNHHVTVRFNDRLVDDQSWFGIGFSNIGFEEFRTELPQSVLREGENAFDWTLDGYYSYGKWLDWVEVAYQRDFVAEDDALLFGGDLAGSWTYTLTGFSAPAEVWDVTYPLTPTRLLSPALSGSGVVTVGVQPPAHAAGAQFYAFGEQRVLAPLSVSKYVPPELVPPLGADWIAITHRDFMTEVVRLADYRASRGMRTAVVDVADLYNQFSYGIYQPAAIHDFLAQALTWSGPAPAYALLVGDGNWNFRAVPDCSTHCEPEPIYIPPYLGFHDPYQGEVPADNQYATLVGDDPMPDIALGRLPVRSLTETATVVDKIVQHEASLLDLASWQYDVVFLADDPDAGGDFHQQTDETVALLPDYLDKIKIYHGQAPYDNTTATREAVVAALNSGATFFNYRGHGSVQYWGLLLFYSSLIPELTNAGREPVVLTMDCLDTYFAFPGYQALSEDLIRHDAGGSVGHWGSSGLGLADDHSVLHQGFYDGLLYQGETRFGDAVLAAKWVYWGTSGVQEHNLQTFTVLGDPALALMASDLSLEKSAVTPGPYLPGESVSFRLDLANHGLYWGQQVVVGDLLPAQLISPTVEWAGLAITPTVAGGTGWQVAPLVPNATGVITLTTVVAPDLASDWSGWITNTASITAVGLDWQLENNTDTAAIEIAAPGPAGNQIFVPLVVK